MFSYRFKTLAVCENIHGCFGFTFLKTNYSYSYFHYFFIRGKTFPITKTMKSTDFFPHIAMVTITSLQANEILIIAQIIL